MAGDRKSVSGGGRVTPPAAPRGVGDAYYPSLIELRVAAGIFSVGFLVFTLMLKVAVPIALGEFRVDREVRSDVLDRLPLEPGRA